MGEIKYKLWDKHKKKFVELETIEFFDDGSPYLINSYGANRFELIRFTGLKDKNSKEIFEGDLVKKDDCVYKVVFDDGCFTITDKTDGKVVGRLVLLIEFDWDKLEVIGNIYEGKNK